MRHRVLVKRAVATLGGLDVLVSNAGIEHFGPLESITVADYERVFKLSSAWGRLAEPEEIAAAVAFLVSPRRLVHNRLHPGVDGGRL